MMNNEFLLALATNLAYDIIKAGESYLRKQTFNKPEQQALHDVYQDAFKYMIIEVLSDTDPDEQKHVSDLLSEFIRQSDVAIYLLNLALSHETPPLESLREHFEAVGFDAETIPFDDLFKALIRGLDDATAQEACKPVSPLINRLIVGRFDAVSNKLDQLLADKPPAQPVSKVGALYGVPALPLYFLNRSDALNALQDLVIADVDKPTLISAENRTTALEGMGGIGKSVLATAFAHDRKVRFAFPDGIVWLIVGQNPSLYELYRSVGIALGDSLSNYPDETTACQSAQKALSDKKCLLILDDVWELAIGQAFRNLITGTSARLLMTTRNLQINNQLDANEYRLKLVDESEAVEYLQRWVGDDPDLGKVAKKLGYLFLALKLAGALMKENQLTGAEYLSMFERVSDMEISPDRDNSLEISINLGVDRIFNADSDGKLLYHMFGIFLDDARIPQKTILQLWKHLRPDIRAIEHMKTLTTLVNLGLVERDEQKIVTLHDLLHSYTQEKLGERYVQTHQDLLASYRLEVWHELSADEPYLWPNIAYHLVEAGEIDILRRLLLNYEWLQAKLNATDTNALISDCDYVTDDEMIRLIKSLFGMSQYILDDHKDQLHYQIVGRLWTHRNKPDIAPLWRYCHGITPLEIIETQESPMLQAGGALLRTLVGHMGKLGIKKAIELSSGRFLSWAQTERTLRLWDAEGQLINILDGHTEIVYEALKLLNGNILSWAEDDILILWNADGQYLATLKGHTESITGALILSSGDILSWSDDRSLRIWDAEGQPLTILEGHTDQVTDAVELSSSHILSWSEDNTLRVWNTDGQQIIVLNSTYLGSNYLYRLKDPNLLYWLKDQLLCLYEERCLTGLFRIHNSGIEIELSDSTSISWSFPKNKDQWVIIRDQLIEVPENDEDFDSDRCISLSNGNILSLSDDYSLRLWSEQRQLLSTLEGHEKSVIEAIELSNGNILSWSHDKTLRLWSEQGQLLSTLEGHEKSVTEAIELSNGNILSWSSDKTLRLWSTSNFQKAISSDREAIEAIYYIDDRILTLSYDGILLYLSPTDFIRLDRFLTTKHDELEKYIFKLWSQDGQLLSMLDNPLKDDRFKTWIAENEIDISKVINLDKNKEDHQFIGDSKFTYQVILGQVIILGDKTGRVIFLRIRDQ